MRRFKRFGGSPAEVARPRVSITKKLVVGMYDTKKIPRHEFIIKYY